MNAARSPANGPTRRVLYRVRLLIAALVLLPILLAAGVSYLQVRDSLVKQAYERLHKDNRYHSAQLLARLLEAMEDLQALRGDPVGGLAAGGPRLRASLRGKVAAIVEAEDGGSGEYSLLLGELPPGISLPVYPQPDAGAARPALTVQQPGGRVWMSIPSSENPAAAGYRVGLHALLKNNYLFGDEHEQLLIADLCIFDGATALYCTTGAQKHLPGLSAMQSLEGDQRRSSWTAPETGRIFARFRDVFLPSHFDASSWTVVTIEEEDAVFAPIRIFRWLFPSMLAVLILSSLLLVSILTRRRFKPLDILRSGARRLGAGDFQTRIEVNSRDEFEELAESFNSMAAKLGNQFGFLTTMSNIDRILLSRPNRFKVAKTIVSQVPESLGVTLFGVLVLESGSDTGGEGGAEGDARLFSYEPVASDAVATEAVHVEPEFLRELATDDHPSFTVSRSRVSGGLRPCFRDGVDTLRVYPLAEGRRIFGALFLNEREVAAFDGEIGKWMEDIIGRLTVAFSAMERQQRLYQQAHFDDLTGLPNRALFVDRLEQDVRHAERNLGRVGVIYADLDRFKVINDTHGHFAGDEVLRETACRLRALVRESDTVARLSGDEFVFALPGLNEPYDIMSVVEGIVKTLEKPFNINGQAFLLDVSIGVSMYPENGDNAEDLLKNADLAMYRAKATPASRYRWFEEAMNSEISERSKLGQDLLYAIGRGELSLAYQPQVDARTHRIHSVEALLRWHHPVRGLISPAKFVPICEETGAIQAIGEFALRQACAQFSKWRQLGLPIQQICVNISPYQVLYSDLPTLVVDVLAEYGVEPHHLELEITESLLIDDYAKSEEVLAKLKCIGVGLALDDFGTGYSSLAHIHQLSFDTLKIDKCFLDDLGVRLNAGAIIESILALGTSLGKNIVAEGIESEVQLRFLQDRGCHLFQGYYFSKPVTADELENLLSRGEPLPFAANEIPLCAKEPSSAV